MLHHKHVRHTWYAANLAAFAFAIFGSLYAFFAAYADAPVVQGTVTKQDGSGVPNVIVELHTPDGLFNVNTTTDVSGNYTLVTTLVHNTNYVVETRALDGYNRNEPHQQSFLYQSGDGVRIFNFGLTQATKTITGHVQDENGVAITDADINITPYNISGASSSAARTDASGNFSTTVLGGTWFAQAAVNLSEYTPQWIAEQPPVRIDFANDATVESQTVNFTVTRATGQVSVRLLNSDNTNLTSSNFVADIDIRRADGAGTVRKVRQSDSVVSVFLTPGIYSMCAFHPDLNGKSFDPVATTFVMTANGNVDLGTVSAQVNTAHLKGKVVNAKGQGLGNVQIQAIRENGCDRPTGVSAPDGTFDLTVGPGTWTIGLNSADPQYSQLAPTTATVVNGQTVTGLSITLKTIDKTISGRVLNLAGQPITDYVGLAFVTTTSRKGKVTAPVVAGQFTIKYSSSDIAGSKVIVGVESSDGSDYTGSRGAQVSITGPSATKDITVRPYDASLNGTLLYPNGTAVTGFTTTIDIVAVDADGNFTSTSVNPASGTFALPLAAGTWFYDYEIDDPDGTANLMNKSAGKNTVTVKAGQTVVKNVKVAQGRNTVTGTVTDADGLAVKSARVTLDNRATLENSGASNADSIVEVTTETDASGVYSAVVPDGTFMVTVGETPAVGDAQLPPDGKVVTVSGATSKVVNLAFERTNATIKGKVTYKNKAEGGGTVVAWSDDGSQVEATVKADGTYTLNVTAGETWHVDATDLKGNKLIDAEAKDLKPKVGSNTVNLSLGNTSTVVPGPVTKSFAADQGGSVSLPDGTTVTVPPFAIDLSGTVSLTVVPTIDLDKTTFDAPATLAYEVKATDGSGYDVKSLLKDAEITIPYNQSEMATNGLVESRLSPTFFDPQTETWESSGTGGVVDTVNNLATLKTSHLTKFSVTGTTKKAPKISTFAVASSNANALVLTVSGKNFSGKLTATLGSAKASKVTNRNGVVTMTFSSKKVKKGSQTLTITNGNGRQVYLTKTVTLARGVPSLK